MPIRPATCTLPLHRAIKVQEDRCHACFLVHFSLPLVLYAFQGGGGGGKNGPHRIPWRALQA